MHIRSAEKNCELCNAHVENQTSILIHANALIICQFHQMNYSIQQTDLNHKKDTEVHILKPIQKLRNCETNNRLKTERG